MSTKNLIDEVMLNWYKKNPIMVRVGSELVNIRLEKDLAIDLFDTEFSNLGKVIKEANTSMIYNDLLKVANLSSIHKALTEKLMVIYEEIITKKLHLVTYNEILPLIIGLYLEKEKKDLLPANFEDFKLYIKESIKKEQNIKIKKGSEELTIYDIEKMNESEFAALMNYPDLRMQSGGWTFCLFFINKESLSEKINYCIENMRLYIRFKEDNEGLDLNQEGVKLAHLLSFSNISYNQRNDNPNKKQSLII